MELVRGLEFDFFVRQRRRRIIEITSSWNVCGMGGGPHLSFVFHEAKETLPPFQLGHVHSEAVSSKKGDSKR
jgi:hypothetical protein